jgi:hypothetical protein
MKKILTFVLIVLTYFSLSAQNYERNNKSKENCKGGKGSCAQVIDSIKYDFSYQEKDGLIYMRLEEKLARDVYLTLGKIYKQKMFVNIPKSEQRHMNAIKALLDKHKIADPVTNNEIGSFSNPTFKKLCDDLIKKRSVSFNDAMLVGQEI